MREIKFRAWTGSKVEYNVMAGWLGAFYVQGIDEKDSACMSPFNTIYGNQTPVMQYTGLKDKNGKEIYEGDVVVERTGAHPSVVEFRDGSFQAVHHHRDISGNPIGEYEQVIGFLTRPVEVIGNIYEKPELLQVNG